MRVLLEEILGGRFLPLLALERGPEDTAALRGLVPVLRHGVDAGLDGPVDPAADPAPATPAADALPDADEAAADVVGVRAEDVLTEDARSAADRPADRLEDEEQTR